MLADALARARAADRETAALCVALARFGLPPLAPGRARRVLRRCRARELDAWRDLGGEA